MKALIVNGLILQLLIFSSIIQAASSKRYLYKLKSRALGHRSEGLSKVINKYKIKRNKNFAKHQELLIEASPEGYQDLSQLIRSEEFEYFIEDSVEFPAFQPNDQMFGQQWMHEKIQSYSAWTITTGSQDITVAVCDSGVDPTHEDLEGKVLTGLNLVDGTNNTGPITNHGTMVAGLIGAIGDNQTGIAGVNWRTKILPMRITNRTNGSTNISTMVSCIERSADMGAKVINLSFTGAENIAIHHAAIYARSKGALLVMAGGNHGKDRSSWPDYDSFIAVGATDRNDKRASYSNFGLAMDLFAPGHEVLTTIPGNRYSLVNGTSFAAPVVAGLASLIWSVNPNFQIHEIENILFTTSDPIGADRTFGHGRINAYEAIKLAYQESGRDLPPVARITLPSQRIIVNSVVEFSGRSSYDNDEIISYRWKFSDGTQVDQASFTRTFNLPGHYKVQLIVEDSSGQTHLEEKDFVVYPDSTIMFVQEFSLKVYYTRRTSTPQLTALIRDEHGLIVRDAWVTMEINGKTSIGQTNSDGRIIFRGETENGKYFNHQVRITNIEKDGYLYHATFDRRNSGEIRVGSIFR